MKRNNLLRQFINICLSMIVLAIHSGCAGNPENKIKEHTGNTGENTVIPKPASSYQDSLVITTLAAVFYNPDSLQLEKIKAINKKATFESMQHELFYQMRNARIVLKKYWPHIQVIETNKARYLVFVKADKSRKTVDLDAKNDMSGIFLFNMKKDPELIDMMNIDTALEFYFKN